MGREYDYDLFTIGAGSGGVRASRLAAATGARVAVAEKRHLGGTCVNLGCIPKKLMSHAAHFLDDFEDAEFYGWDARVEGFDWARLIENKDREIARLNGVYEQLLQSAGVEIHEGHARLVDPHTVEVAGKTYTSKNVLVVTGGWPVVPNVPGAELAVTSNEMFHLKEQPKRILIVGGGYIAVEFASILNALGTEVTLVHRRPAVLRGFDEDVRTTLTEQLAARGIDMRMERTIERLDRVDSGISATLSDGTTLEVDKVLCAVGRRPNTETVGLRELGVKLNDRGAIVVDEQYRSSVPSIYALGDVIDRITLTPVAIYEAIALVSTLFMGTPRTIDYRNIASAVFSNPPVACVGLTEAQAKDQYGAVDVYMSSFRPLRQTLTDRAERTLMKLLVDPRSDLVVGCHILGPDGPEIMQGIAVALKCGATKAQFDSTVGIHPTAAEELVTMRTKTRTTGR